MQDDMPYWSYVGASYSASKDAFVFDDGSDSRYLALNMLVDDYDNEEATCVMFESTATKLHDHICEGVGDDVYYALCEKGTQEAYEGTYNNTVYWYTATMTQR